MTAFQKEELTGDGTVTQRQIAEQLGVSRQLVGFALRGEGRMADSKRKAILEAARRGGYHEYSNREARAMVSKRYGKRAASGIMAVLFNATFEAQPVSSVPFFTPFFEGLESEAIERGVDLVLCAIRPQGLPRLVRDRQVDGVVALLTPDDVSRQVVQLALPTVSILYDVEGSHSLRIDDKAGTFQATQHLIDLGHREIAYVGLDQLLGEPRLAGYHEALHQSGLSFQRSLVDTSRSGPSMTGGAEAMKRLLRANGMQNRQPPFSGLVCYNDPMAMGAIGVLKEAGWRVPHDISVVGFDDVSTQYGFTPSLTSISFARREIGRRAIELLYEAQSEEEGSPHSKHELFPTELIARDSTAPPRKS